MTIFLCINCDWYQQFQTLGLITTLDHIGGHRTTSEFHSLQHRTKSNYIGHSQYHIEPPKSAEQVLKLGLAISHIICIVIFSMYGWGLDKYFDGSSEKN